MNDSAATNASTTTSPTFTEGTIQPGARPGTRTTVGSITVCRVRSARTSSFEYESHYLVDHVDRSSWICRLLLLDQQIAQFSRIRNPLHPAFINKLFINRRPLSHVDTRSGYSERRGFAIDCSSRADHEVAGGDQVRAVQRRGRNDQTFARFRRICGPLSFISR